MTSASSSISNVAAASDGIPCFVRPMKSSVLASISSNALGDSASKYGTASPTSSNRLKWISAVRVACGFSTSLMVASLKRPSVPSLPTNSFGISKPRASQSARPKKLYPQLFLLTVGRLCAIRPHGPALTPVVHDLWVFSRGRSRIVVPVRLASSHSPDWRQTRSAGTLSFTAP